MTRALEARTPGRKGLRVAENRTAGYSEFLSSFVAAAAPPSRATLVATTASATQTNLFFLAARPGTPVGKLAVRASAVTGGSTVCQRKPWRGGAQEALVLERTRRLATSPRTDNGDRVPARLEWLGHIENANAEGPDVQPLNRSHLSNPTGFATV